MEKAHHRITTVTVLLLLVQLSATAQLSSLGRAAKKGHWNRVERIMKHKICEQNRVFDFDNRQRKTILSFSVAYDTIVHWLKTSPVVEDAMWDKCMNKIDIYPGYSAVGVRFKTKKGIVEKCFVVQEGTTGNLKLFGWHPHLFRYKWKLKYKRMRDCKGFVQQQKEICEKRK